MAESCNLVFYTNPMSRGRIARWMLEESGAEYRTEVLEYGGSMKAPEYLAINPMGKVPCIRHGETVVAEAAAVCVYLAEAFPEAGLAPRPEERGAYYRWMFFAAGPLEQALTNKSMGFAVTDEQGRMAGYGSTDAAIDALEYAVSAAPFVAGDRFTAADVYVGSHVGWGLQFGTLPERPAFKEYFARTSNREPYRRATALDDALMPDRSGS